MVQQDARDAEALRRRLYRPDASPEDLEAYRRARALAQAPPPPAPVVVPVARQEVVAPAPATQAPAGAAATAVATPVRPVPTRRTRLVVGAVGALAAAAIGGALLSGVFAPAASSTAASPSSTPTDVTWTTLATRDPGDSLTLRSAMLDTGKQPEATGTARVIGPEQYSYRVARGDSVAAVAARFRLCPSDVLLAMPYGFTWPSVRPGQELVLSRTDMSSDPDVSC